MRMPRLIMAGVLLVGWTVAGGAGSAVAEPRQVFLTAPYAESAAGVTCSVNLGLTGACDEKVATADASNGSFRVSVAGKSLSDGQLPSLIQADGFAALTTINSRTGSAPALLYAATLSISELTTGHEGTVGPVGSITTIVARATLIHNSCAACKGSGTRVLTSNDEEAGLGTVQVLAVLFNPSGADVPAGDVKITVGIEVDALFVGAGTMHASVAGTLTQVEAAAPSLERVVGAPYTAAKAERSCGGSLGTTFVCRSAAASTTGRVEMDLEVISPVAGTAPGSGDAIGEASIGVDDAVDGVRAVVYILNLHITSADAYTPSYRTPFLGTASGAMSAVTALAARDCTGCASSSASAALVDAIERPFRLDDAVPFVVWMTTNGVPQTPEGSIDLRISGAASLRDTPGQALVRLDAVVASVRAIEIA